ncbi:MAG: right-handed parallel beta-helix repeat-containing protein [Candidatus Thermoplasmatota archaeon]|nr:right-handed parallel beta-helix repeat-containing protein [Candidatus Thermoplasmatota archaeon]
MRKRSLTVAFLLLASAFFVGISVTPSARAATLYVGGAGPGNYSSIQGAIDMASSGDTVFVYSGTYNETVEVRKTLSLVGENKYTTVITDETEGGVVRVSGYRSNVTGFTVINTGQQYTDHGISVSCEGCLISGNRILASEGVGIILRGSWTTTVSDNTVVDGGYGIYSWAGIGNLVTANRLESVWEGIHADFPEYLTIANNTVLNNGYFGIWLFSGDYSSVLGNNISHNSCGLWLEGSRWALIANNTFIDNQQGIQSSWWSENSRIYHNYMDNPRQVWVHNSTNDWDNGYPSGGNYWSDYTGVDVFRGPGQNIPGSDGIGDTPYIIDEDTQDNYPLMRFPPSPIVWVDMLYGPVRGNATQVWSSAPSDVPLSSGSGSCGRSPDSACISVTSPASPPALSRDISSRVVTRQARSP